MACFLALQPLPVVVAHQADAAAQRRQPAVGVVVPQQQPILGPRLVNMRYGSSTPLGHQVVDQHADVRLAAVEDQRRLAA